MGRVAPIQGIRIQNFGALKDVTFGTLWSTPDTKPLTPLTAVIGQNGAGKSSIFNAFAFLGDCLKIGVEEACDLQERGGFHKIRSHDQEGAISFEIYYKQDEKSKPITYEVSIGLDNHDRPYVESERLLQRKKFAKIGEPTAFLTLKKGRGFIWSGDEVSELNIEEEQEILKRTNKETPEGAEEIILDDPRKLGIATLGALKKNVRISAFREFIEGWYLSYFSPDSAREIPKAGAQKHLNIHGDNLGNVVQFMEREDPAKFQDILDKMSERIPGIGKIKTHRDDITRTLHLLFEDNGFTTPFSHFQMSDGTLKVFAYLLLLEDPSPAPFLCIEEPENGLYHKLLDVLAEEFRIYAEGDKGSSQVFITTHQPYLVDSLEPEEVWILEKQPDGFSQIHRASDNPLVQAMVEEGQPLGSLWFSDYLDSRS